jgi:hypothetical protein
MKRQSRPDISTTIVTVFWCNTISPDEKLPQESTPIIDRNRMQTLNMLAIFAVIDHQSSDYTLPSALRRIQSAQILFLHVPH